MYNKQFLDTIDKVNSIAKTLGFTNGVAWARHYLDNGKMSECTFEIFSSCHDLRNLMAHGYARDINISAETMQRAIMFYNSISKPYENRNFILFNTSNINPNAHLEVQIGDYVIIMNKNKVMLGYTSREVGYLFKVIDINQRSVVLETWNDKTLFDLNRLRNSTLDFEKGLYVFKNNPLGLAVNNNTPIYIINEPQLDGGVKGTPFIRFEFMTTNPSLYVGQQYDYRQLDIKKAASKGYVAHIDCFDKTKSKPLLDFSVGNIDEYLNDGYKKASHDFYEDDLPF